MTSPSGPTDIWFLTGSQEMYGPETLRQVADQSRQISDSLDPGLPVKLVWKPVLTGADAIRRVMLDANASSYGRDDESRHLFHIGVTRAAYQLWVLVTGDASPILKPRTAAGGDHSGDTSAHPSLAGSSIRRADAAARRNRPDETRSRPALR